MATVTVSIGRNVGDEPMSAEEWASFALYIGGTIRREASAVYVDSAESRGEWNGVAEDSRTWVAECATFDAVNAIAGNVQRACARYRQDAIAVTVAGTFLIGA